MLVKLAPHLSCPHSSPFASKRLVYLDQSFLSHVCFREEHLAFHPILERLFLKLQNLKAMNRIALVISDVHCRETSAFPGQSAEKMEKLWQFQNDLADGCIATNWADIFVAQHQRILVNEDFNSYPVVDIRLRDPYQIQIGMRVVRTNSWLLRIHRDSTDVSDESDNALREIIDRQVENTPSCQGVADCLNYIRDLWCNDIQLGIAAWRQRRDFLLSFKQLGESPDAEQLASLQIPELRNAPLLQTIYDVTRGLDAEVVLQRWSALLKNDPIGPCPSLRIRTALEAELLWTWYEGKRRNPKKFREYFGWSRQNDIDHVSAFAPYVDALTTDKDMHNLCEHEVVIDELKRFPCKIFSTKNYAKFEEWLDELSKN